MIESIGALNPANRDTTRAVDCCRRPGVDLAKVGAHAPFTSLRVGRRGRRLAGANAPSTRRPANRDVPTR